MLHSFLALEGHFSVFVLCIIRAMEEMIGQFQVYLLCPLIYILAISQNKFLIYLWFIFCVSFVQESTFETRDV